MPNAEHCIIDRIVDTAGGENVVVIYHNVSTSVTLITLLYTRLCMSAVGFTHVAYVTVAIAAFHRASNNHNTKTVTCQTGFGNFHR